MRHLSRTHRVSVQWMHEQYNSKNFTFAHESGEKMPPDIFTKMVSDRDKWKKARYLINAILPDELEPILQLNKDISQGILENAVWREKKSQRKR